MLLISHGGDGYIIVILGIVMNVLRHLHFVPGVLCHQLPVALLELQVFLPDPHAFVDCCRAVETQHLQVLYAALHP